MIRSPIPLAPFFISIYPIINISAANAEEGLNYTDILFCLGVAVLVSGVGLLGARRLTAHRGAQTVLAFLFAVFSFWYGSLVLAVSSLWSDNYLTLHATLLPLWGLAFLGVVFCCLKIGRHLKPLQNYLDVFTGLLLLFGLVQLLVSCSSRDPTELALSLDVEEEGFGRSSDHSPDIYFIILDQYTGPWSLKTNFDFDLQPFIDSLQSRGFYVPRSSRANYVLTHLSLASMLNWTHLDSVAQAIGVDSRDRSTTYAMIEYNRAFRFLKKRGYRFVFIPSAYAASWRNRFADEQLPEPFRTTINFRIAVFAQTPLAGLVSLTCLIMQCEAVHRRFPFVPETARQLKDKLESLRHIARQPGPKLVLMHLLSPHEPYIFREDCSQRPAIWPASADAKHGSLVQESYVDQIVCLNRLLLSMINGVLANSATPPVIILQSDHGHGRMVLDPVTNRTIPLEELSERQVRERTDLFAAYLLPYDGSSLLYDSISPVNIWPVVLNHYFDAGIQPLEDATYWSNPASPFRLTRLRSGPPGSTR